MRKLSITYRYGQNIADLAHDAAELAGWARNTGPVQIQAIFCGQRPIAEMMAELCAGLEKAGNIIVSEAQISGVLAHRSEDRVCWAQVIAS